MPLKPAARRKSQTLLRSKAGPAAQAVTAAVEQISELIRAGRYELGEVLDASALEKELDLSASTVRVALQQLAAKGAVELNDEGKAHIPSVTKDQLLDMLRVQDALMRLALEEMVASASYSLHMGQLFEQARKMRERAQAKDLRGILRGMIRYHEVVSEASSNAYLVSITRRHYLYHFERGILDIASFAELERAVGPYEKATQALLRRDAVRAHQCMNMHNYDFIEQLEAERAAAVEQGASGAEKAETVQWAPRKRKLPRA